MNCSNTVWITCATPGMLIEISESSGKKDWLLQKFHKKEITNCLYLFRFDRFLQEDVEDEEAWQKHQACCLGYALNC